LKKKDSTEESGIESYVRSQIEVGSLEWIPSRTCYVLEKEGKSGPSKGPSKGPLSGSSDADVASDPGNMWSVR
jgi:hypothetical protein